MSEKPTFCVSALRVERKIVSFYTLADNKEHAEQILKRWMDDENKKSVHIYAAGHDCKWQPLGVQVIDENQIKHGNPLKKDVPET